MHAEFLELGALWEWPAIPERCSFLLAIPRGSIIPQNIDVWPELNPILRTYLTGFAFAGSESLA
jgi:hypothetical protein